MVIHFSRGQIQTGHKPDVNHVRYCMLDFAFAAEEMGNGEPDGEPDPACLSEVALTLEIGIPPGCRPLVLSGPNVIVYSGRGH